MKKKTNTETNRLVPTKMQVKKKNQNFEPSMFQQEEPIKVKRRQP